MIREAVARYGSNDWSKVCQKLRTQQITPEQCQMRWENVLRDQTVKVRRISINVSSRGLGAKKRMQSCVRSLKSSVLRSGQQSHPILMVGLGSSVVNAG